MAVTKEFFRGKGSGEPLTFRRAALAEQRVGLGLLLVGKPRPFEPAVDQFLSFIAQQKMTIHELWLAFRGQEPIAAVLLVPSPGRTAILFISPTIAGNAPGVEAQLARQACAGQDPTHVGLIQAILDPGQRPEAAALTEAGFTPLAELIYMQRSTQGGSARLELPPGVEVHRWSAASRPIFTAGILASYEQTLDCPGLLGLRTIDDIIAGHMASGKFVPELWLALTHGDEPVAVMLINPLPQRQSAELVYLGLAPKWRGRGLGRRLLSFGLAQAAQRHAQTLSLAVDDSNTPAMRLYEAMGFVPTGRKLALIRAIK